MSNITIIVAKDLKSMSTSYFITLIAYYDVFYFSLSTAIHAKNV